MPRVTSAAMRSPPACRQLAAHAGQRLGHVARRWASRYRRAFWMATEAWDTSMSMTSAVSA